MRLAARAVTGRGVGRARIGRGREPGRGAVATAPARARNPIAVSPKAADPRSVATDLAVYSQADRVLVVSFTAAEGAELLPV